MSINAVQRFTFQEAFNCTICLSNFYAGEGHRVDEQIVHVFCTDCFQQWFSNHDFCPTCRSPLEKRVERLDIQPENNVPPENMAGAEAIHWANRLLCTPRTVAKVATSVISCLGACAVILGGSLLLKYS